MIRVKSKRNLAIAFVLAMLLTLWVQLPNLLNPYAVEDDFRNLYWLHQYSDPTLFPHSRIDHLDQAAPGYAALFRVGMLFVSPILFSKLLAFPLMLVAVYYVFGIVEQMAGERAALAAGTGFAIFNLAAATEISVSIGLQRSFAVPLLAAFTYYLMKRRYAIAAIVIVIASTLYIPVVVAMVIAYVLSSVRPRKEKLWHPAVDWRSLAYLAVALLAVVVLLWPAFVWHADNVRSTIDSGAESVHLLRNPRYRTGGARPLFFFFPIMGRGGLVSDIRAGGHLLILGVLALVVRFVRRNPPLSLPPAVRRVLIAGFIAYALSWLAIIFTSSLLLYNPSRHTRAVIFLVLVIYVFANAGETLRASAHWLRRRRRWLAVAAAPIVVGSLLIFLYVPSIQADYYRDERWLPVARWLLLVLGLLFAMLAFRLARVRRGGEMAHTTSGDASARGARWGRIIVGAGLLLLAAFYLQLMNWRYYAPGEHEKQLYSFLETLPKDILLAGDPCSLDSVPLYAKRSVLFNCERLEHLPAKTINDALRAYYAAEWQEIYAFCQEHGVTHLIVNAESYTDEVVNGGEYFFEPYSSQVADTIRSRPRYVLAELPAEDRLFEAGDLYVVGCQDEGSPTRSSGG